MTLMLVLSLLKQTGITLTYASCLWWFFFVVELSNPLFILDALHYFHLSLRESFIPFACYIILYMTIDKLHAP